MKKICLIISFIICLLCFVGCKNQNEVINPNIQDNQNQEQTGNEVPNEDENLGNDIVDDETESDMPTIDENLGTSDEIEEIPNEGEVELPTEGEELPNEGEEEIPSAPVSAISNSLTNMVTKAEAMVAMPMQDAIPAESSLGFIGLSEEDFNKYVTESVVYESMISPAFQSICIVRVNDTSKIADLKKSILENANPRKWLCTSAEKAVVVDCGEYIMLAMSTEEICGKLVTAFGEEFNGTLGETLTKAGDL